jgi:hypothetical protein
MIEAPQPDEARRRGPFVLLVAFLAIALALTGGVALVTGGGFGGPTRPGQTPPSTQPGLRAPEGFPENESNLRVISVDEALQWAQSGQADGRAMAVAGWWIKSPLMSCPYPGRDPLPIEGYCTDDYVASAPYENWTCHNNADGSGECHGNPPPSGVQQIPALVLDETAGAAALGRAQQAVSNSGIPVVLIVHVGDLRSRQCPASSSSTCSQKAIVDSVAWVEDADVEFEPKSDMVTAMTADEAIYASRSGDDVALLSVFPVPLGDAWMVDPRFHGVGDNAVWVLRVIPSVASDRPENPSRAVEVRLVDDATGQVLFRGPLAPGPDYMPARLVIQSSEPTDASDKGVAVFYRVEGSDGQALVEARLGSTMPGANDATRNSAAAPVLLDPGTYRIRIWQGLTTGGRAHFNECAQDVTVVGLQQLQVEGAFPTSGDCKFVDPSFVNPFDR